MQQCPLFSKNVHNQGKEEGDQDAGGKGEIEGEILSLYENISRKFPEPGNFIGKNQDYSQRGHQTAKNDKHLTHTTHGAPFPGPGGLGR